MKQIFSHFLLLLLTISICRGQNTTHIQLGELHFDINQVSNKSPYKTKEIQSTKTIEQTEYQSIKHDYIFTNISKTYFLKESSEYIDVVIETGEHTDAKPQNTIKFYDRNNIELWAQRTNLSITKCRISSGGDYIHTNQEFGLDNEFTFITYDKNGNIIKQIDDLEIFYTGDTGRCIYYIAKVDNRRFLSFYNYTSKNSWKRELQNEKADILAVSDDETLVLYQDGQTLKCIDKTNQIKWSISDVNIFGVFDISFDNKYLLWLTGRTFSIIDISSGQYIVRNSNIYYNSIKKSANHCSFIPQSHDFILPIPLGLEGTGLVFYNIQGEALKSYKLKDILFSSFEIVESISSERQIIFDKKIVYIENRKKQ